MKVAVIGGMLQGIEASYLAQQAGWQVFLIDRNPHVPARGLAHSFIQLDVMKDSSDLSGILKDMDLIIPALENYDALKSLADLAKKKQYPLAFDKEAYAVTSSKQRSNLLFNKLRLPVPQIWPDCGFPAIMKPSRLSGSQGIRKIRNDEEMTFIRSERGIDIRDWVIQEFLDGPSYSLEVIGHNRNFRSLQTTIIEVDKIFDCKRVIAPADLPEPIKNKFNEIAVTIAEDINLNGIMDVEIILHQNELKVLEIDARLPSQTPSVVLKSTGVNILEMLYDIFNKKKLPAIPPKLNEKAVIYEHIRVNSDILEISGEHIISEARPLNYQKDFFGADEALTDFDGIHQDWVATLILSGKSKEEVEQRHVHVLESIRTTFGLQESNDLLLGR
jgi:pyrrolysine biosynthesis protein PylC